MKNLKLHDIRKLYLDFFESKAHLKLGSFSLIPKNDKSLLLIGAGMAPMKKYFTGELTPPSKRVTTCQKCIRTGDIDNVGKTDRHATFFEMLGNFSFGDYFKKEAISWAWEFLTEVIEIEKEKLWVTIYLDDDEAFKIWNEEIGLPKERIVRLGKDDNFWELEVGPSGPCSEIYVDRGEEYGNGETKPGEDGDRFIEVWNLVFTQFDKDENGEYHPLSHPNIDTGMGLERLATVLQGTDNIFEVDAIVNIINKIEEMSGYKYGKDENLDISVRVITDHIRAITFLVSDTVRPSNEGRGYVLRRLIRRAARHGKNLGLKDKFLNELSNLIIDSWGESGYPELIENRNEIVKVIKTEEEKFLETIEQGLNILNNFIDDLDKKDLKVLGGEETFKLYDTFGFPIDLTKEILHERGYEIDHAGFEKLMEEQRQKARAARDDSDNIGWSTTDSEKIYDSFSNEFVGYDEDKCRGKILAIVKDGNIVDEVSKGDRAVFILDKTPFYGEGGGQIGDIGFIENDKYVANVVDTKKTAKGLHLHIVEIENGSFKVNDEVLAEIDSKRRNNIRRNHSVTHLLHKALKEVLGEHVHQAGSLVKNDSMRFDFTHYEAISKKDLKEIENRVNEKIFESLPVVTTITNPKEAMEMGAVGLFEEKYGNVVRVLSMGDYSVELCGGTHVKNTSEICMFKILSESGVSSGVRRIESITGPTVYLYLNVIEEIEAKTAEILKINKNDVLGKVKELVDNVKKYEKELERIKRQSAKDNLSEIIENVKEKNKIKYVIYRFNGVDVNSLRNIADEVRDKLGSVIVLFATENEDKINFVCAVSKDLVKTGYQAGNLVREVAKIAGGSGGGRDDMATAGAKDSSKIDEALKFLENLIK